MYYKELLVIYILEILSENANKENKMYQQDVSRILEQTYNIELGRKTLSKYIAHLRDAGYIKGRRGIYKVNNFSDSQLRVLIDSILFAPYIPAKEAKDIIKKLKDLSPISLNNKIRHIHYVQDFSRTKNTELYPILDIIDEAIEKRRKIKITVCRYNKDAMLENVRTEIIDPYYIVNSNSRYYVICYADRNGLESRRIDRISKV